MIHHRLINCFTTEVISLFVMESILVAYKGVDCYLQHYCPKKCLRVRYHGSNVWEKWGNAESEIGLNVNHIKNKKRKKKDNPMKT